MNWRRLEALALAASRMTPRMAAYQVRRAVRNQIARRFPAAYGARMRRLTARTPERADPALGDSAALKAVSAFYNEHYRSAAEDAARGRFTLYGHTVNFGSPAAIDWSIAIAEEGDHQLWRMKLGHMGFVCPLLLSPDPNHHQAAAELVRSFMAKAHDWSDPAVFASFWFPYSASHRLLAIGSAFWLNRTAIAPDVAAVIEPFLRLNVAFVRDNIEHEARNNHVERNLAALCLFYDRVPGSDGQAAMLDREVRRLIDATVGSDGVMVERSAMYQGLTVMSLRAFAATTLLSDAVRALAAARADAAAQAWANLSHPDGEIALFNDAWIGETPPPRHLAGAVSQDGRVLMQEAGYARLSAGGHVALFDAGPIGPRWNPGHGHADFLSLEMSLGGRRFLVDPGTSQYSTGPERLFERSSASHNGPRYEGQELLTYAGCFKVGRLAQARLLPVEDEELAVVAGALDAPLGQIRRLVAMRSGGGFMVIDHWARHAQKGRTRLLIPDVWTVTQTLDGLEATQAGGMQTLNLAVGTAQPLAEGRWCRRYLHPEPAHVLELRPEVGKAGDGVLAFTAGAVWPDAAAQAARLSSLLASL